jgi:hypothetical protein
MLNGRQIAALLMVIGVFCLPQASLAGYSLTCQVVAQSPAPEPSEESGTGEQTGSGEESESGEEEEPDC